MSEVRTLSKAAQLNVAALVLAAAGIGLQIAAGSDLYPTIPPGPIILLAAAALVAVGPGRWAPYVGVVVPAFLTVGAIVAATASDSFLDQLTEVGEVSIFLGSVIQLVGLVIAVVAGVVMWRERRGASTLR